jgi:hypothetical protein
MCPKSIQCNINLYLIDTWLCILSVIKAPNGCFTPLWLTTEQFPRGEVAITGERGPNLHRADWNTVSDTQNRWTMSKPLMPIERENSRFEDVSPPLWKSRDKSQIAFGGNSAYRISLATCVQRDQKVTSLVAHSSRGRCTQHLRRIRGCDARIRRGVCHANVHTMCVM